VAKIFTPSEIYVDSIASRFMIITNKTVRELHTEFDNKHAFSLHLHIFVVNCNGSMSSGFLVTTAWHNQLLAGR
jgi:hypothetical protein